MTINRREYAGSTKYSDEDLKELNAGEKTFMERVGLETARFLLWFAETRQIPKISTDRKTGGLAVMGWSMGVPLSTAVLGYPEVIEEHLYTSLEPYFRRLILYGACSQATLNLVIIDKR